MAEVPLRVEGRAGAGVRQVLRADHRVDRRVQVRHRQVHQGHPARALRLAVLPAVAHTKTTLTIRRERLLMLEAALFLYWMAFFTQDQEKIMPA